MCPSIMKTKHRRDDGGDTLGLEDDDEEGLSTYEPQLKAVVSTSKRWLRARLREAGIKFTVPLAPDAEQKDQDEGKKAHNVTIHIVPQVYPPLIDDFIPLRSSCLIYENRSCPRCSRRIAGIDRSCHG